MKPARARRGPAQDAQPRSDAGRGLLRLAWGLAIANLVLYWLAAVYFGGTALGGKVEDGRHFVHHKREWREVSEAAFHYLRAHLILVLLQWAGTLGWTAWMACRPPRRPPQDGRAPNQPLRRRRRR